MPRSGTQNLGVHLAHHHLSKAHPRASVQSRRGCIISQRSYKPRHRTCPSTVQHRTIYDCMMLNNRKGGNSRTRQLAYGSLGRDRATCGISVSGVCGFDVLVTFADLIASINRTTGGRRAVGHENWKRRTRKKVSQTKFQCHSKLLEIRFWGARCGRQPRHPPLQT